MQLVLLSEIVLNLLEIVFIQVFLCFHFTIASEYATCPTATFGIVAVLKTLELICLFSQTYDSLKVEKFCVWFPVRSGPEGTFSFRLVGMVFDTVAGNVHLDLQTTHPLEEGRELLRRSDNRSGERNKPLKQQ